MIAAHDTTNIDIRPTERRIVEDENSVFDDEVRQNVENYKAPYDAASWPVLDQKITEDQLFRRRLIGAKILEIAAILIALVTFYNVFLNYAEWIRELTHIKSNHFSRLFYSIWF